MVGRPTEVELKLGVTPEQIAALRNCPGFADSLQHPSREILDSVYFDSDERFLRNHGLTLRVRRQDEKRVQTIKSAARRRWRRPLSEPSCAGAGAGTSAVVE